MKPTTLAAAIAGGYRVILRGHGRSHSPGDTAFQFSYAPERGLDPPELAGFFIPVAWRDGEGWRPVRDYNGRPVGLPAAELVTPID